MANGEVQCDESVRSCLALARRRSVRLLYLFATAADQEIGVSVLAGEV